MKPKLIAALKTWIVIYPSITLLLFLFGSRLSAMPLLVRTFLLTAVLVPWLLFAGMPALNLIIKQIEKIKGHDTNS